MPKCYIDGFNIILHQRRQLFSVSNQKKNPCKAHFVSYLFYNFKKCHCALLLDQLILNNSLKETTSAAFLSSLSSLGIKKVVFQYDDSEHILMKIYKPIIQVLSWILTDININ
jgi:hypothetical protein